MDKWGLGYFDVPFNFKFGIGDLVWFKDEISDSYYQNPIRPQIGIVLDRWCKGMFDNPTYRNTGYLIFLQQSMHEFEVSPDDLEEVKL